MRDPKQERQAPDTKASPRPVQWQTNDRREETVRDGRDIETDRSSSEQDSR